MNLEGLEEITRSSPDRGKPNVHATYTVKKSDNVGTLRINKHGVEFIKENNVNLKPNELHKMFFDSKTFILAFKQDKNGQFKFTEGKDSSLRLSYKDLSKRLQQFVEYRIQPSDDFAVLLIPVDYEEELKPTKKPENRGK